MSSLSLFRQIIGSKEEVCTLVKAISYSFPFTFLFPPFGLSLKKGIIDGSVLDNTVPDFGISIRGDNISFGIRGRPRFQISTIKSFGIPNAD